MSNIDERIVQMTFKSAEFVNGVNTTLAALRRLKDGLNFKGAEKGLNDLNDAGKRFSLDGMGSSVDRVASHFSAMRIAGITALANITNRAVDAGISLVKSLTVDPISAGLNVYETKINAIQTILANTQSEGTKLSTVTAALNQLNTYANKTVYNFGQMAQNIGVFTAAGVNLQTSVSSIKGIANLAALSGASAEQASGAMYQLSQAIASGSVKLQDWNSVVNAGLGGKVFQNALIETARVHGVAVDAIIKKNGSFRQSLQSGWLTANILTETLAKFTGDLSAQQLKALGYTNQQIKAIQAQARAAVNSATQIRTITQLQSALREEVATAWANVWEALIGNIGQATTVLTRVHNVAENMFTQPLNDLAKLLQEWVKLGGRDVIIKAISNAFNDLHRIITPVKEAFRDVFPPATAKTLLDISNAIERLTERLRLSSQGSEELRRTFTGIFSVVRIVLDVIKGLFGALGQTSTAVGKASGGFLAITARIGDFLSNLRKSIESGNALANFFRFFGTVLSAPIKLLGAVVTAITGLGGASQKALGQVEPYTSKIAAEFAKLGQAIGNAIKNGDFSNVLTILNQVLFGGVLLAIRKFFTNLGKGGSGGGLFSSIKESFESLTKTLTAMQTNLKSGTLLKIAEAVALLAASLVALSLIDTARLVKSLTAITVMFTELLGAMAIITKIAASGGIVKMGVIAGALVVLSTSILILSGAVAILAQFSWEQLAKGLGSIAALLGTLVVAVKLMSGENKGLLAAAISINAIAIALNVLAGAVALLGHMDLQTLGKGVGTIAALLLVIATFNTIGTGKNLISTAASMVILGAALNIVALAVKSLGTLPLGTLAKGILGIAAALLVIGVAMALMPKDMFVTAAALLVVAEALEILSKALVKMGAMSWGSIAKALVTLAGALVLIAAATILMTEALPGAAALLVVAGALAVLAPVLIALGSLSWSSILKGLAALAGVFLVLGAAGILLAPLVPILIGLGAAVALLGVGLLAAGAGVAAFAVGLTALAVAGGAAVGVLVTAVTSLSNLIPTVLKNVGRGLVAFATVIGDNAPAITNAIARLLVALLNAIIKVVPKAGQAFGVVMNTILLVINQNAPRILNTFARLILNILGMIGSNIGRFVTAGVNIIVGFLRGIANNTGRVVSAAFNIVIVFIRSVASGALRVVQAGVNTVISFINGVASAIRADAPRLHAAGVNLAEAIVQGMVTGIFGGIPSITSAARSIASSALAAAKSFLGISSPSKEFAKLGGFSAQGFAVGLSTSSHIAEKAAADIGSNVLDELRKSMAGIGNAVQENMDLQPRITPVLDLTKAKKGFNDLAALSKAQLIAATTSSTTASSISAENAAAAAAIAQNGTSSQTSLSFTQNNYSPKALSSADIYRQTNNQLSVVKGALPK